jgi:hypothetical protein
MAKLGLGPDIFYPQERERERAARAGPGGKAKLGLKSAAVLALCGIFNVVTFMDTLQWSRSESKSGYDPLAYRLGHAAGGMVRKTLGENDISYFATGVTRFGVTMFSTVAGLGGELGGMATGGLIAIGKNDSRPSFEPR